MSTGLPTRFLPPLAALALAAAAPALAAQVVVVAQKDRAFGVDEAAVERGGVIRFTNEDDFPHQISISGAGLEFDSGLQGPGELVEVAAMAPGLFQVRCGIHPRMRMAIRVR